MSARSPLATFAITATAEGGVRISVRAKPRSRASRVAGVREGALVVELDAPPVDGAANDALIETLAETLGVRRKDISILRGATSRDKLVEVRGVSFDAACAALGCAPEVP